MQCPRTLKPKGGINTETFWLKDDDTSFWTTSTHPHLSKKRRKNQYVPVLTFISDIISGCEQMTNWSKGKELKEKSDFLELGWERESECSRSWACKECVMRAARSRLSSLSSLACLNPTYCDGVAGSYNNLQCKTSLNYTQAHTYTYKHTPKQKESPLRLKNKSKHLKLTSSATWMMSLWVSFSADPFSSAMPSSVRYLWRQTIRIPH